MNRRESLRTLGIGAVSTGLLLDSCKTDNKKLAEENISPKPEAPADPSRKPDEIIRDKKLEEEKFFTAHEMLTIGVLADIIIPKDSHSGSASDAKVPDFIEFIVKDMPDNQTPMRGGLRWLDLQSLNRYNTTFREASNAQQIELVTEIAYPEKAKPEMLQGVSFFNLMRDLTASGFFSSQMGVKDVGYMGNTPGPWNGVPDDVLKAHGFDSAWG